MEKKNQENKGNKSIYWVGFAFIFSIFVFIPYEVYFANVVEFNYTVAEFITPVLVGVISYILLLIVHKLLRGKWQELFVSCIFSFTLAGYVQSMFLNGMMHKLDGTQDEWRIREILFNLIIWIIILCINFWGAMNKKEVWKGIYKWGGAIICGAQAAALVSLILTYQAPVRDTKITTKGLCEVADGKNVIIFVLDKFDQQYIDQTLELYPEALDRMEGFTYYPDATGKYCYTHIAIPYLLTGTTIPEYDPTQEQYEKQMDESSYFKYLLENVGNVGVYTSEFCIRSEKARSAIDNCLLLDYSVNQGKMAKACMKSSLYRVAPLAIKKYFSYSSEDFNMSLEVKGEAKEFNNFNHQVDAEMMDHLEEYGLGVNAEYGDTAFRFIHLNGTHYPYSITVDGEYSIDGTSIEECAVGEFNLIAEYCDELERLGLFEDATIIVTSDHGAAYVLKEDSPQDRNVNPIFFYKPAGVGRTDALKVSNAPVAHDDVFKTVLEAYGTDGSDYGYSLDEVEENMERTRYFYWCSQDPEITDYESCIHIEYAIQGDARDNNNWQETGNYTYPNNSPKHVSE